MQAVLWWPDALLSLFQSTCRAGGPQIESIFPKGWQHYTFGMITFYK